MIFGPPTIWEGYVHKLWELQAAFFSTTLRVQAVQVAFLLEGLHTET